MLVVLDANVWVSALISGTGAPGQILRLWQEGCVSVAVSPQVLDEIERVLRYPRLRQRYSLSEERVRPFLTLLQRFATVVVPVEHLDVVDADPTDNRYLECARAARVTILVTSDRHLLALGEHAGVQILTSAGFLAFLRLSQ